MKFYPKFIIFILFLHLKTFGQTGCDSLFALLNETTPDSPKIRAYKMTVQLSIDNFLNYTERDTMGRVHFLGRVGSLEIESYFANGKRYSKIQSPYIQDDEWTFQEVESYEPNKISSVEYYAKNAQIADCQMIGEGRLHNETCKIFNYSFQKLSPKRNGIDSFLMTIRVKTWVSKKSNTILKHEYETTTEQPLLTIKTVVEYDTPVKILLPKKAKSEQPIALTPTVFVDTNKSEILLNPMIIDSSNTIVESSKTTFQTEIDTKKIVDSADIATMLDQSPEYKDGLLALSKYISTNINYPEEARKEGISGTVYVAFVVETDGKLTDIGIKKGLREDIDAEAIRLIKSMSGAWKAGKLQGKAVRSVYTLPLKFELHE